MQEGVAVFACLHHDLAPCAVAAVGVDQRQLAADDGGGVRVSHHHDLRCHSRGGGFSVCARDADGMGVGVGHITQKDAALHGGDTQPVGLFDLRVALHDGGGIHHQLGSVHVFGLVSHGDRDAQLALAVDDIALVHVRACDLIAHFMQDLHQREHAAAANAHKVQLGFAVQQFAVECVHIYHLVKIRLVLLTLYIDLMVK